MSMSIRPTLLYGLLATLSLSLMLAIGDNLLTARALLADRGTSEAVVAQQGWDDDATVVDSSDFLRLADLEATKRGIRVISYHSVPVTEDQGRSQTCQIILSGEYRDLTQWLRWLEQQNFLQKIAGFTLMRQGHGGDNANKTMQLTVELLLMS